jgi:hypothetical protein
MGREIESNHGGSFKKSLYAVKNSDCVPCVSLTLGALLKTEASFSNTLLYQGCQMVCFQTQNPNLGNWKALLWKILVYFISIRSILWLLEIFYGHLVYFVVIWNMFPRFGILDQEKSGNPALYILLLP